ncbi:cyclin-dependent kinase inhibitor 3 family protein [Silanimonas algicola]
MTLLRKTSQSHPLRIDTLPFGSGKIGLTFCPGKRQSNALNGVWDRDLAMDLDVMADWGCNEVMTLVEPWELEELCVPNLGAAIAARGWRWHHWPILDGDPPDHRLLHRWTSEEEALRRRLRTGGRLLIHCKGGLGRAGTVATMLLAMEEPDASIESLMAKVRSVRPGAIENTAQEAFLGGRDWLL